MVRRTVTGWVIAPRTCWFQIIQIFRWTPAMYQSPKGSVPPGAPGPAGTNARPGVCVFCPVPPGEPPAAARSGLGVAFDAFLGFLASTGGRPFFGSSLGGLMILGASFFGGSAFGSGWGAGGAG